MRTILIILFTFCCLFSNAQVGSGTPWMKNLKQSKSNPLTFKEIVDAGNAYWKTRDKDAKGSGYKPFKRWESFWQNYVNAGGFLPTSQELWEVWDAKNSKKSQRRSTAVRIDESNWESMGPTDFLNRNTNNANLGRVNTIIVNPSNSNVIYVGSPAGGIWKSTDAGATYIPLTDHLPQIGVSGIAIDTNNTDILYIATGDDDYYSSTSVGVWKSTDAGANWQQTGLNPSNTPYRTSEIYINPTNSNMLWVATSDGIFKSTNGGDSWENKQSGSFRDLKVKPSDPNIIYGTTDDKFYKSTDAGETFTHITDGLPILSGRLFIDITPANNNLVYMVASNTDNTYQGIYKSLDSGTTFTQMENTTDIFEGDQSWYDLAIGVSNTNENEIYVGCLNVWKSSDGGDSFSQLNQWYSRTDSYTHADIHFIRAFNNGIFVGSDGGIFESIDAGNTFSDLSPGLGISQFYRISVSKQDSNKIAGGLQDNGGFGRDEQWSNYHGGDGMEGVIDPNNDNIYYGFSQNGGSLNINTTSGQNGGTAGYGPPYDEIGNWITPLSINKDSELYAGYSSVYNFDSGNWTKVSDTFEANIEVLELDPINSDIMYVSFGSKLHKSLDHGVTFSLIQDFTSNITSVEVNNNDNSIVYFTTSGGSGKVYRSTDQGTNFTEITGTLPNVTKNIIKHQPLSPTNALYLGTSLGVFRYDDLTNDWGLYETNLPNTDVRDLSINTVDYNITAGTHGRGIWRSDLQAEALAPNDIQLIAVENLTSMQINCGAISPKLRVLNNGQNSINNVDITYSFDGVNETPLTWTGTIGSQATAVLDLVDITLAAGFHTLSVTTTTNNDYFTHNNSAEITFYVNETGETGVVNTFENSSDELIVVNEGEDVWQRGIPTGALLNTAASGTNVYGTNLSGNYADNSKGYLTSKCYDLTTIANPVLKFQMAFYLETNYDVAYVQYSTNQGVDWEVLGTSADSNWYNSSLNECNNCVGGQWTGTDTNLKEYSYDLAAFSSQSNMIFRMVFHSDSYINLEGVVIDDLLVDGTVLDADNFQINQISVYPNPSKDVFYVKLNNSTPFDIRVTDITGKVVYTKKQINATTPFPLQMETYSSGIYFLQIRANNQLTTRKLVLN
ncbi:T9SS type A sorting domain-containing protein [Flavobacteriaceae bacterium]|nr:T9SS type A sorting domain-containing protein [Flavobacteriaceae bacterium]